MTGCQADILTNYLSDNERMRYVLSSINSSLVPCCKTIPYQKMQLSLFWDLMQNLDLHMPSVPVRERTMGDKLCYKHFFHSIFTSFSKFKLRGLWYQQKNATHFVTTTISTAFWKYYRLRPQHLGTLFSMGLRIGSKIV